MRVGIDHTFDTFLFRHWPPAPIEIEPFRCSVEFNPCPGTRSRVENFWDIDFVRLAFQKQTTGRMRQHGHERIFHPANHASGHIRFAQTKSRMNGSDYEIELRQNFIGKIKRAVPKNVAFNSSKETEAVELFVQLSNRRDLREQFFLVEAVGLNL